MEDFYREYNNNITVITVNLTRATLKEAQELKKVIEEERLYKHKDIILDLHQCEFIDSTFLGTILLSRKLIEQIGGNIKIIEPPNLHKDLLVVTRVFEKLELYKSKEEAIKKFNEPLPVREIFQPRLGL